MTNKGVAILVVVFGVFLALYHYPFIATMNTSLSVIGIPTFLFYLITIWLLLIVVNFFIVKRSNSSKDDVD